MKTDLTPLISSAILLKSEQFTAIHEGKKVIISHVEKRFDVECTFVALVWFFVVLFLYFPVHCLSCLL